jgi:NAD(P)-dependent dehydrogenase (short-subunit alcohol dehydrogenase family)
MTTRTQAGQTILVSGKSRGIGFAIALRAALPARA